MGNRVVLPETMELGPHFVASTGAKYFNSSGVPTNMAKSIETRTMRDVQRAEGIHNARETQMSNALKRAKLD